MSDINSRQKQFAAAPKAPPIPVVVGGDLNTIVGGLASLSSEHFDVLANKLICTPSNEGKASLGFHFFSLLVRLSGVDAFFLMLCAVLCVATYWERVLLKATQASDLPFAVQRSFVPHDSLWDPWHKRYDKTLWKYLLGVPYYSAKLDWLLLSKALHKRLHSKVMGGDKLSDHLYLSVELR